MRKGWLLFVGAVLLHAYVHGGEILINLTNQVWRYDQSGAFHNTFAERSFDDSMWPEGRSILAYEDSTSTVTVVQNILAYTNTVLLAPPVAPGAPNHTADYFRTRFTFSGAGNPDTWVLTLSNLVDDGYVAYLNGVEIDRFNMNPANDMLAATAGGSQGEGVYIFRQLCIPAGTLVIGENVLAVRVHQTAGTSADVVWGTVLHASPGSAPMVLWPLSDVNIPLRQGGNTNLVVTVQASPCATYQWYKNDQPIAGATSTSFTIANMEANQAGTYFLRSVNAVGSTDSPNFIVTYQVDVTPPTAVSASADVRDLSTVRVTFSEDVIDLLANPPFDPLPFYVENRDNPGVNVIGAIAVSYGSSSNVAIVTLAEPRDPAIRYQLVIMLHNIEDRFGNRLSDPTVVPMTIPYVFQNGTAGYVGTVDTELSECSPDQSNGNLATISVDLENPCRNDGLLRFENIFGGGPNQIPYGAWIMSAKLRLYTVDHTVSQASARMLRMLVPWNEQSTWNSMGSGINQTNGVEAGVTDAVIDGSQDEAFDEIDVTAAVQAWANGEPNYGWAFLATSANSWDFPTSENAEPTRRPALIVEFWIEGGCSIEQQPEPATVEAGYPFELSVLARGANLRYEWFFDPAGGPTIFSPIAGATNHIYRVNSSKPSDAGRYYVVVRGWDSACTSSLAQVTVLCHGDGPSLLSAIGNADQSTIRLVFNDSLDAATAQNVTNYAINGGLSITNASILPVLFGSEVLLTTSGPREVGRNYILTVRNLRDNSLCTNVIYPNPTVVTLTQDVRVLSFDAVWRYHNEGEDLGAAWRNAGYDDTAWPLAPGLLGFETTEATLNALSNQNLFVHNVLTRTNFGTGLTNITDYFRTMVNVPFDTTAASFTIRHVVDDGAVFYFNGTEVSRYNMPAGEIRFDTVALTGPAEGVVRSIPNLTGLTNGWNSVAVEVHNQGTTSGDVLFGAELIARVQIFLRGGLTIHRNADGSVTLAWADTMVVLQQAFDVNGPWTDVSGATNPLQIQVSPGKRFYRLRGF